MSVLVLIFVWLIIYIQQAIIINICINFPINISPPACEYVGKQIAKCFYKCTGKGEGDDEAMKTTNGIDAGGYEETKDERKRREQEDRAYEALQQRDSYG